MAYVALGDSITYGNFASVLCDNRNPPAVPLATACPSGTDFSVTDYVVTLAHDLVGSASSVTLINLGLVSAELPNAPSDGAPSVLHDEIPKIPSTTTLVTLYIGTNDVDKSLASGDSGVQSAWKQAYADAIASIKSQAPNARIVLANVPNQAQLPKWKGDSTAAALDAASRFVNQQVINPYAAQGFTVVDLACDSRSYDAGYLSSDGLHPNNSGHQAIAQDFFVQITATVPSQPATSCPPWF